MIYAQDIKLAYVFEQVSKTNGATASGYVDTFGYDYCSLVWMIDNADDTAGEPSAVIVSEGDTATAFTAIGTFDSSNTTDGFTIPASVTENSQIYKMDIDLRGRKRYLKALLNPQTTMDVCCIALLTRGQEMPDTTTEAGVALLVQG